MKAILKGGKILNRGFKGVIINMYNDNPDDNHTLYKELLMNSGNKEISLITVDGSITLEDKDFDLILKLIKKRDKKVLVKKFVTSSFMFDSNAKNFNSEIEGYRQLIQIFKDNVTKYTTIKKGFSYKHKDIYGITFNNNYYVFLEKCFNTLDNIKFTEKTLAKCVKEIIEILDILNANNYIHNDIKPDNIIYCDKSKRFKLIDWELSSKLPTKPPPFYKGGTSLYNHPLKFYLGGLPGIIAKNLMMYSVNVLGKHKWVGKLKAYEHLQKLSKLSLEWILHKENGNSSLQIHKKYYPFYDNYAFAVTIIFLAERNRMKVPDDLIKKLMEPMLPL